MNQKLKNQEKMDKRLLAKGKIIDYSGKEHLFIVAGIRVFLKDEKSNNPVVVQINEEGYTPIGFVRAGLKIGISICNPIDEFNEKIGSLKALNRAENSRPVIYSAHPGQIDDIFIKAYLYQEIKYIEANPEKFIKGYKDAKARYIKNKEMEKVKENFTDAEKEIVENLKSNPTYLDNVQKYLDYWNKCGRQ